MATLNLLDLAKRSGSDAAAGLVEEVLTVAPELSVIPTVPKSGTSYKISRRTSVAQGAFRNANEGTTPSKSKYEQAEVPMFFFDGQMVVDEAIVKADDRRLGDILADEGAGQLQGSMIGLGDQVYRGVTADAKGFAGLKAQVLAAQVTDATGAGANATNTAWAVRLDTRTGMYLPVGNMGAISLGAWTKQQVVDPNDATKRFFAWVNNLSFYIGLALASQYAIGCVKNITTAAGKGLTDALGATCYNNFPVGRKPTHWFMSREAVLTLQLSRSAVGQQNQDAAGKGAFAPRPTELAGLPIVETDSIAKITNW